MYQRHTSLVEQADLKKVLSRMNLELMKQRSVSMALVAHFTLPNIIKIYRKDLLAYNIEEKFLIDKYYIALDCQGFKEIAAVFFERTLFSMRVGKACGLLGTRSALRSLMEHNSLYFVVSNLKQALVEFEKDFTLTQYLVEQMHHAIKPNNGISSKPPMVHFFFPTYYISVEHSC